MSGQWGSTLYLGCCTLCSCCYWLTDSLDTWPCSLLGPLDTWLGSGFGSWIPYPASFLTSCSVQPSGSLTWFIRQMSWILISWLLLTPRKTGCPDKLSGPPHAAKRAWHGGKLYTGALGSASARPDLFLSSARRSDSAVVGAESVSLLPGLPALKQVLHRSPSWPRTPFTHLQRGTMVTGSVFVGFSVLHAIRSPTQDLFLRFSKSLVSKIGEHSSKNSWSCLESFKLGWQRLDCTLCRGKILLQLMPRSSIVAQQSLDEIKQSNSTISSGVCGRR